MAFNWTVAGGLEKPFYLRARELRKKYDLSDKGLVECLIWFTLTSTIEPDAVEAFRLLVETYKTTAPVDMPILPSVE